MRTLVVHTGGVGDFLLFCPALQLLAHDAHVELAGNKERLALAVDAGLAHAAHDLDAIHFASIFAEPAAELQRFLRKFDRAIAWMRDDNGELARAIRHCGVRRVECFPSLPPSDWSEHASAWYTDCLGMPPAPPLRLQIPPTGIRHDVIIHPGSGSQAKNWPLDHFRELAMLLEQRGRHAIWSRGPAEREQASFNALAPALDPMPLAHLARHVAAARLYIGNDSGVTHLAAAVGCPTIAIFRPTNPHVWAPVGGHVRIIQNRGGWPNVLDLFTLACD